MPVIAESPPLLFGNGEQPPVTETPETPAPPSHIIIMPGTCNLSDIVKNHTMFIERVDAIGACFKRDSMPELTDQEFIFHTDLAITDKYLVQNGEVFCSMQSLHNLSQKLKRFRE